MLRILVDLHPRLLADTVALALGKADVVVDVARDDDGVRDERAYDLVVVQDAVRLARPARLTVRVDPTRAGDLAEAIALLGWLHTQRSPVPAHPDR